MSADQIDVTVHETKAVQCQQYTNNTVQQLYANSCWTCDRVLRRRPTFDVTSDALIRQSNRIMRQRTTHLVIAS